MLLLSLETFVDPRRLLKRLTEDVMSVAMQAMDETQLAEEIVSVLPAGAIRVCSAQRDVIRYAVRGRNIKLRSIVLQRSALRRLLRDRDGLVKIEYLQRDLIRSYSVRSEFTYPRPRVAPRAETPMPLTAALSAC
jgi:hypothetical protein